MRIFQRGGVRPNAMPKEAVRFGTCCIRMRKTTQRRVRTFALLCTRIIDTFLTPFVCEGLEGRLERQAELVVFQDSAGKF